MAVCGGRCQALFIIGALVNGLLTIAGAIIGIICRRVVSQDLGDFLIEALGLCSLLMGLRGLGGDTELIYVVVSMVIGCIIGHFLDIDGAMARLGRRVQDALARRLPGTAEGQGTFAEGFVSSSVLICTGSMAIVGSLNSGLSLDHEMLVTKGVMDMVVVCAMAASMGAGVILSGFVVFAYEGVLSLLATLLAPLLTDLVIAYVSVTGSLLLLCVGMNMIGITHIKVANMLPAAFVPMVLIPLVM